MVRANSRSVSVDATTTGAIGAGRYSYDLVLNSGGTITRILEGKFIVTGAVTQAFDDFWQESRLGKNRYCLALAIVQRQLLKLTLRRHRFVAHILPRLAVCGT